MAPSGHSVDLMGDTKTQPNPHRYGGRWAMGVMGMQKEGAKPHPSSRQGEMAEDAAQIPPPPSQLPIAVAQSRQGVHGGGWERHCGCCSPHPNPCPGPGLKALPVPNCGGLGLSPGVEGVRRGHRHLCAFSPLQSTCRRTYHIPEGQDGAGGGTAASLLRSPQGKGLSSTPPPPHKAHGSPTSTHPTGARGALGDPPIPG